MLASRAALSLLGVALAAVSVVAMIEAEVEPPGGGCFGQPSWAGWVDDALVPLSVLAAAASAALLGLRLGWSVLMRAAFAFSIAVFWLAVVVLTGIAAEGPC